MEQLKMMVFDGQITKNFNINEFKCSANGEMLINADTIAHIQRLQKLRDWYAKPMSINSGYRTLEYNRKIGSPDTSYHIIGIATDILLPYYLRKEEHYQAIKKKWYEICAADGLGGGVGFYKTFFHLDSAPGRRRFWDER